MKWKNDNILASSPHSASEQRSTHIFSFLIIFSIENRKDLCPPSSTGNIHQTALSFSPSPPFTFTAFHFNASFSDSVRHADEVSKFQRWNSFDYNRIFFCPLYDIAVSAENLSEKGDHIWLDNPSAAVCCYGYCICSSTSTSFSPLLLQIFSVNILKVLSEKAPHFNQLYSCIHTDR